MELHMKLESALKRTVCKLGQNRDQHSRDCLVRHSRICRLCSARQAAEMMLIDIVIMALVDRRVR